MRWTPQRLAVFIAIALATVSGAADSPVAAQAAAQVVAGLTLTCETYCSDTNLGTSIARVRWSLARSALASSGLRSLTDAKASLEVTVFSEGLEKGAFVTLPVPGSQPVRPIAAVAQPKQPPLRAYQIQIVQVEQARAPEATDAAAEAGVLIEGLEPGVNYTWRIVLETASGRIASAPVTCQAATCPVDDALNVPPVRKPPPVKKPPPAKKPPPTKKPPPPADR